MLYNLQQARLTKAAVYLSFVDHDCSRTAFQVTPQEPHQHKNAW